MKVFELKRNIDLKWEDIPFVECPVFATTHTMNALIHPSDPSSQVTNIREFIVNELGVYDPLRNHNYAEERVNSLMGFGHYFSICRSGKPFVAAFTWKEDKDHPHQGVWIDPLDHYWMSPNRIKNLLAEIASEWHRVQSQSYMDELMDSPYAIARAVEDEYLAIPKAKKEIAVKPVAAVMPATKIVKPVKNAIPVQKNESTQSGSSFKLLKGKYGSAKNYGNLVVVNDVDDLLENHSKDIKNAAGHQCYAVAETVGLPYTEKISAGEKLVPGKVYPRGTVIATFVENDKGELVYPSQAKGRNNYVEGVYGHLALIDEGGLSKDGSSLSVIHQYASGLNANKLHQTDISNKPQANASRLVNQLDKYYVVKIK